MCDVNGERAHTQNDKRRKKRVENFVTAYLNNSSMCRSDDVRLYFGGAIYSRKWTGVFSSLYVFAVIVLLSMCAHFICRRCFAVIAMNGWASSSRRRERKQFSLCSKYTKKKVFLLALLYIYCCCYITVSACSRLPSHFFRGKSLYRFFLSSCCCRQSLRVFEKTPRIKREKKWMDAFARTFDTFLLVRVRFTICATVFVSLYFRLSAGDGSDRSKFVRREQ